MSAAPRRVLVTGYEPFDGERVNPSQLLVERWRETPPVLPAGVELHLAVLPVARRRMPAQLAQLLDELRPEWLLALGQHARHGRVTLERFARNRLHFGARLDNDGDGAHEERILDDGPARRESTLPVARLAHELAARGLPVTLSEDAGSHLCNALLYQALGLRDGPRATFVHLPLLPEQASRRARHEESLDAESQARALGSLLALVLRDPAG